MKRNLQFLTFLLNVFQKNKVLSLMFLALFSLSNSNAQVTNYTFSESNGTYTAITGGTVVASCNGCGTTYDTTVYGITLPSGSEFPFNLATISQVTMLVDGSLILGTTAGVQTTGPLANNQTANGIISPLGMDLRNTTISGQTWEMRWQDVGSEVVFQWTNASRWLQNTAERFSFQIRINKTTGVINVVYGNMTTIANSTTYQPIVGLRGAANTDYNNRRLTTAVPDANPNWGAPNGTAAGTSNANTCRFISTASCYPTSGLTFTWSPNASAMDWNNMQWLAGPSGGSNSSLTVTYGDTVTAYAQGYESGVTDPAGAGTGVSSWIGYSTTNSNPNGSGWTWLPATFSSQQSNNDEFSATLSGLAVGTYYVASRWRLGSGSLYTYGGYNGFWNGTGNNSIQLIVNPIPNATLPYTDNFSSNNYTLINGAQTNKWAYGAATGNAANALYISNNGGTSNAYSNGSSSIVHAYRDITIPSGTTTSIFSFDWKANGESCCDYLKVWLVPSTYTPIAGTAITTGSGRVQVGGNLNSQTTWQTYSNPTLDISTFANSTMRLVFEWTNDGSLGTNPPAAVDNISLQLPSNDAMDYNNMQWLSSTPASGRTSVTVPYNTTVTAFARGYEAGVTNGAGAGTGVAAWIGYSTTNTNPNTAGWTWVAATYNQDYVNDDEFQATLNLPPGTYYVASRWKLNSGSYTYGGSCADDSQSQCGGTWDGTTNKSIILIVNSPVAATMPYTDDLSTFNFQFTNGTQTNKWVYGSATGNAANALYISNNGGTTNAYDVNSASVVQTYRDITIPSGTTTATLKFDWLANGESCCDYLRVWMVPTTFTPTAGTQIASGSGNIQIGGNLNGQTTWQTYTNAALDLSTFAGSTMRLVFEWRNDGSIGTNPPAAVDNVNLFVPAPITITPASSTTFCSGGSVSLTASSAASYTYTWSPATGLSATTGATVTANPTTTTTYTVTGVNGGMTNTQTVTVTVTPSPTAVVITNADAPICADAIQTLTATGGLVPLTIFSESFASGLGTFTATNTSTSGTPANAAWTNRANGYVYSTDTFNSNDASNFVLSNSDSQGSGGTTATTLITPVFSLVNITSPTLKFYHYYRNSGDTATVQISTDGGTTFPTTLATYTSTQGTASAFALVSLDLSAYAGMSNLTIRFKYDAAWDWYWAIDNVSVTGSTPQMVWSSSPASPNTMFTDAACTTAYNGTDFRTTLYVKPSTTTTYTATATLGTCTATDTVTLTVGTTTWAIVSPANTPSWDNGAPTSTVAAVISADYTTGGTSLDACSLTVNNNAVVVISSGDDVTLSSGSLTVVAGSTYTQQNNANLIQTNANAVNSGGTIIERNSTPMNRLDYTMWCAPVSGTQTLQNYSQYTLANRFYEYNTATDLYNSISNAGTWSMAKGYLIRVNNTWPAFPAAAVVWPGKFRGTPNNGTKTFTLSTAGNGFNAVGNPYPSALKVDDFINANSTQIDGTLWFWRKTNDTTNLTSYSTCTTAGCTLNNGHSYANADYLSVGQGFLVKAKAGATAVTFDNTMRASTNVDQFFKANNTVDRYWVSLNTSTGASFQNLYAYLPDATLNYDNGKDGIFYNDTTLASLSSVVNGVEMVIQARPSFVPTDVIPLMFKTTEAGTYSISLYQTEGVFAGAQDIFVKDNLLNTTTSIKQGAYTFTSDVGTFTNRFELVYQPALSVNTANFDASVQVIKQNDDIVINAGNTIISKVKVFDTRGRLLIDKKNINASEVRLASDKTQQVLLVQITSNEGKVVTKKIVN